MASLNISSNQENSRDLDHSTVPRRVPLKYVMLFTTCILLLSFTLVFVISRLLNVKNYSEWIYKEFEKRARKESHDDASQEFNRPSRQIKYMLLWTPHDYSPFYYFNDSRKTFIDRKCSSDNCIVTADRNIFKGDLTKFDAIAFNGRNLHNIHLPESRTARQKYIYFNMESAENYPICSKKYNDFFNWTATYRLDSDIPFPYIQIRNQRDEVVGPKRKMEWPDRIYTDKNIDYSQNKTKAVAWFVSNCHSRSNRLKIAYELQNELRTYREPVDVYGACGSLKCPRFDKAYDCTSLLKKDYFFYLSFENSFSEDYVTEKLLTALQNNVVPIVLGGADYSRFLPPGSYLDARNTSVSSLAAAIVQAMSSPSQYNEFFKWKSLYSYRDPSTTDSVCALCAALNNETFFTTPSYYRDFRRWWHPKYVERCSSVFSYPDHFLLALLFFVLYAAREN